MLAIVLCPGPSLSKLEAIPPCARSIAINRAATKFEADIWAAMDYPILRDYHKKVLGNPGLFTFSTTWQDIGHRLKRFPKVYLREELEGWWGGKLPFKTFPASLVFAGWMGATEIDVYGCDWEGNKDFDGVVAGESRTDDRWLAEKKMCGEVIADLSKRGVTVRRMNLVSQL